MQPERLQQMLDLCMRHAMKKRRAYRHVHVVQRQASPDKCGEGAAQVARRYVWLSEKAVSRVSMSHRSKQTVLATSGNSRDESMDPHLR